MSVSDASGEPDFKIIFEQMPGMCLVLDPSFKILAQNTEHKRATLSEKKNVVGMYLFEAFPDNPNDGNADGVSAVRQSLLNVLKTRKTDVMPLIRYDVRSELGGFQDKYWAITNIPVLGADGFVRWIINRAENVTGMMHLRAPALSTAQIDED